MFADVVIRRLIDTALTDLDIIAENFVISDLKRFDAGLFPFRSFHLQQKITSVMRHGAQFVHFRHIAFTDNAFIFSGKRRIVRYRAAQNGRNVFQQIKPIEQGDEKMAGEARQIMMEFWQQ